MSYTAVISKICRDTREPNLRTAAPTCYFFLFFTFSLCRVLFTLFSFLSVLSLFLLCARALVCMHLPSFLSLSPEHSPIL